MSSIKNVSISRKPDRWKGNKTTSNFVFGKSKTVFELRTIVLNLLLSLLYLSLPSNQHCTNIFLVESDPEKSQNLFQSKKIQQKSKWSGSAKLVKVMIVPS